jgi:hypothetical protein
MFSLFANKHQLNVYVCIYIYVAIFRNIALCSPYVNRLFGGMYYLHLQGKK